MTKFPELLVSPHWLADNLNHPQLVIVDCRFALTNPDLGQQQYQQSHIPGAFYLDLNHDLSNTVHTHGGRHPLPDPADFAQTLARIGITDQKTFVVAYDDSRFAFAARLWWLLCYFGHPQIALLDGGWSQWQARYPVTNELPNTQMGRFDYQLHPEKIVDRMAVISCKDQPSVALIDSRDRPRYWGEYEPIDPIAGHIPGAINFPWKETTDETGFVRLDQQRQRWQSLKNTEKIMVYCGSGVTACVNLWSLEIAGISQGKLYVGGWSDWCSYQNSPES
ncbi:MAG: sulfurtransferase [Oscillatoriales cyanobacterium RM2_1_1]|nr:sulfurtransferase [Oscillatoriales cyanobacterium SM2_3_0]NJO45248.1 sulfurtransferase [Oscillatoriales cyanobacterium RM2_1_1]